MLHGEGSAMCNQVILEFNLLHENSVKEPVPIPSEIQAILDNFALVFATPTGLPPRRMYDHSIPLMP